jgi:hypothetical protein
MTAKEKKEPQSSQDAAAPLGSVDQIRDIIFGAQMRDYEERFAILEARLFDEARALREDVQNRFHSLEKNLDSERGERGAATEKVMEELRSTADSIREASEKQRDAMRKDFAAARAAILEELEALKNAKTDRMALSALLRDMAAELDDESTAAADDAVELG